MSWLRNLNHDRLDLTGIKTFSLAEPGPDASRQEAPHPHQAILDPTGGFILVPDLGADLVRVFVVEQDEHLGLTEIEPLVATPGSGPRHIAFHAVPGGPTYVYVVAELANTITAYRVRYHAARSVQFERFFQCPIHGFGNDAPAGCSASEILVSVRLPPLRNVSTMPLLTT